MPRGVDREKEGERSLLEKLVLGLFAVLVHSVTDGRKIAILFIAVRVKLQQASYLRLLKVVREHDLEEMHVDLVGFCLREPQLLLLLASARMLSGIAQLTIIIIHISDLVGIIGIRDFNQIKLVLAK